jgi:hypothetical protein
MLELLLIELALCAPGLMVAACVIVTHLRRGSDLPRMPLTKRRPAAAALADGGMPQREIAGVPGFGHDNVEPDLGANMPAEQAPAAEAQVCGAGDPGPDLNEPSTEPDEQQVAAGTVTMSERIASYYDEADRPMAGYLAARGWPEDLGTPGPGVHKAERRKRPSRRLD